MTLNLLKRYYVNLTNATLILASFTFSVSCNEKKSDLIYIIEWTNPDVDSTYLLSLEMGQEAFMKRNCSFQNCFLTNNSSYFKSILDFDVLLFNVLHIYLETSHPPAIRSQSQLYILVALEPVLYHTIPLNFNMIFNMTLSYKLTADIVYPYILIRNNRNEVIGPRKDMHWEYDIKDMAPTNNNIIFKLRNKNAAAAAVVSNCNDLNGSQNFIFNLKEELLQYGQNIHVYGQCQTGTPVCKRIPEQNNGSIATCAPKIERDYYFYLAFENSFNEDYVSEKVLHGLNQFAVPVVYGGADYTRFLPDGIYLNALTLGVKQLAEEMNSIIRDPQRYIDFFKWHGYYNFYDTYGFKNHDRYSVCNICAKLNEWKQSKRTRMYKDIAMWWNGFDIEV